MTGDTGDEDRLAGLFREAASDGGAPAPGFDHGDVVATSRRITARRRSAVIGGALALFVVAGVGTVAVLPRADTSTVSAAAPAPAQRAADAAGPPAPAAPEAAVGGAGCASAGGVAGSPGGAGGGVGSPGSGGGGAGVPAGGAGGAAPGVGGDGACVNGGFGAGGGAAAPPAVGAPLGPGATTCADRQDPALRALLVQALPEAGNARAAATTDVCLPGSERYVSLELGSGVFTVAYLPPGTVASLAPGATSARTASGGTVIVSPPPALSGRAPSVLQYLAPRL
jgi:hypothetical protein